MARTSSPPTATTAKGHRVIAGRYTLLDEIGRGGMGVVWRAEDEVLGRTVALKKVGMSPTGVTPDLRRAEREARLAARLNHPHVVAVFDLATDGDEQWLVMEYVESRNLADLLREHGPLPPDQAATLLAQAADALAAAHGAGIVHRDVKPSNILVTTSGQVKLTDFGIARAHADATLTSTGLVSGSPAYLAPEVAAGQPASPASDVWALGATLFHVLEGRPPYETGGNVMGTLYQIVHEEPPRSARAGWLAPLLASTMTKEPEQRWSMADVLATLTGGPDALPDVAPTPTQGATQVLPPVAAAPAGGPATPPADPSPTTRTTPVPPASSAPPPSAQPTREHVRSRAWLLPLVGVVLLVAVLALGWSLLSGDDSPTAGSGGDRSGASGSPSPSSSPSPSDSATTEAPSADSMAGFAQNYLATATSDTRSGFDQLTASYQKASGGYSGYRGFWGQIASASVSDVVADPDAMTVSYHVTYTKKTGQAFEDDVTLQLVQNDGGFLIDGAS
jgi:serine/threonine protein kinase